MGSTPPVERRRLQRIPLQGRVTGQFGNGEQHALNGISRNVSAEGMFVFLGTDIAVGAHVELMLELPSHDVFKNKITMRSLGHVVRSEGAMPDGSFGIAVSFDDVEISSSC